MKNGILTFIFAFCPGAGQMYQGYMKRGLSLITMFCLFIMAGMMTGLDALVSLTPETGVVGGIDRETATYWRNNAATAIAATTAGALATAMEGQWRRCIRNGGSPDFILAGSAFIDAHKR